MMIISNDTDNIRKELTDLKNIEIELGVWSFKKALEKFLSNFKINSINQDQEFLKLNELLIPNNDLKNHNVGEKILKYSSSKVNLLLQILNDHRGSKKDFHAIVFVERKKTASLLSQLLNSLKYSFLKCDFVHGINSRSMGIYETLNLKKQVNAKLY